MKFYDWILSESTNSNINWNLITHNDWKDDSGVVYTYTIEKRHLGNLEMKKHPPGKEILSIEHQMRYSSNVINLIVVDINGIILDGEATFIAAMKILGNNAIIPVEVRHTK